MYGNHKIFLLVLTFEVKLSKMSLHLEFYKYGFLVVVKEGMMIISVERDSILVTSRQKIKHSAGR